MSTLLPTPAQGAAASVTPARLLDTPLPDLLAEFGVELDTSSIDDPTFTGYMLVDHDRLLISLPAGRPDSEREIAVRSMLGSALRVPMPPLPAPFMVTEL